MSITLFTIGFTHKSAETFFTMLQTAGVRRVVDVRLNNVSQLAGFTKRADLPYFLRAIAAIGYVHRPEFAPSQDMLDTYKKRKGSWDNYAARFLALMTARHIEELIAPTLLDRNCLLCSEPTAEHCHRRLVAEYLRDRWGQVEIMHL